MLRVTTALPGLLILVPLTGLTAQANSGLLRLEGEKVRLSVAIENGGASWKPLGIEGRENVMLGFVMGAMIGAAIGVERWERIMSAAPVSLRPVAGGFGLRVSF